MPLTYLPSGFPSISLDRVDSIHIETDTCDWKRFPGRFGTDVGMTVAHAPHSWEFLARAVDVGGVEGLSALGRSKETMQAYLERKDEVGDHKQKEPNHERDKTEKTDPVSCDGPDPLRIRHNGRSRARQSARNAT